MTHVSALPLTLTTEDGVALHGIQYLLEGQSCYKGVVLFASAMAVKQEYYAKFASHLAQQGFISITFDYRGIGKSSPKDIREVLDGMNAWGEQDLAAAIAFCKNEFPEKKLFVVTHSAGGQMLGLAKNNKAVDAIVMLASQSGYWQLWPGLRKFILGFFWYVIMPSLVNIFKMFPAKKLGLAENIPSNIARDWARWCRHPDYLFSSGLESLNNFSNIISPILAISIEDDHFAPKPAVDALLQCYSNAEVERLHWSPKKFCIKKIGHFGFFRSKHSAKLWPLVVEWLEQNCR